MDKSTIHTITIVLAILTAAWSIHVEMNDIRGEMSEFRAQMNELRGEMNEIRLEINEIRSELDKLSGAFFAHIQNHNYPRAIAQGDNQTENRP